jgi:hypothetical protein
MNTSVAVGRFKKEKGELPRLKCFHNGIILIVICFKMCTAMIEELYVIANK